MGRWDGCQSDRVSQTVNGVTTHYVLDQAAGLTQVLSDGTNTYVFGIGRIAQYSATGQEYFLTDALGSVRQLVDGTGAVTLAKHYQPYGEVMSSAGAGTSSFGFTGEQSDQTGLIYLRARYYVPPIARFSSRDTWRGSSFTPMSYNSWLYAYANPIILSDPTGLAPCIERKEGRSYCILNNGGYIDTAHYGGGKWMAEIIFGEFRKVGRWGKEDSPLLLEQDYFGDLPPYQLTYRTSFPEEKLNKNKLNRIALGIFMDFQIRYEFFQGIDPRCYTAAIDDISESIGFGHCSSFSNEDLEPIRKIALEN